MEDHTTCHHRIATRQILLPPLFVALLPPLGPGARLGPRAEGPCGYIHRQRRPHAVPQEKDQNRQGRAGALQRQGSRIQKGKARVARDGTNNTAHQHGPHSSKWHQHLMPSPNIMPQPAVSWQQPPINTWQQQQQAQPAQYQQPKRKGKDQKGNKGRCDDRMARQATTSRQPRIYQPVFAHLLRLIQYPQADIPESKLTDGFRLTGDLQPGTNWYIRTDQKYLQPRSPAKFIDHSRQCAQQKLLKPRVDDNYSLMLDEIVQEVKAGRMNGPFRHAQSWPTPSVAPAGYDMRLQPLPHQRPRVAMAFSVKQIGSDGKGKIRRGEDWRRSGHKHHARPTVPPHTRSLRIPCDADTPSTPR